MLHGFVTESDFEAIEECFPGIWRFYAELTEKPRTFLELVWRFTGLCTCCPAEARGAMAPSQATSTPPRS